LAWCGTTALQKEKADFQTGQSAFPFQQAASAVSSTPSKLGSLWKAAPCYFCFINHEFGFFKMQIDGLHLCLATDMLYGMLLC